jgi:hypothetical protein
MFNLLYIFSFKFMSICNMQIILDILLHRTTGLSFIVRCARLKLSIGGNTIRSPHPIVLMLWRQGPECGSLSSTTNSLQLDLSSSTSRSSTVTFKLSQPRSHEVVRADVARPQMQQGLCPLRQPEEDGGGCSR